MNKPQMLGALCNLPEPDMITATKITDPIGAGSFYRADTVVRLLQEHLNKSTEDQTQKAASISTGANIEKSEITLGAKNYVNDALCELAQSAWDKYGVCVQNARFSWIDVSTVSENRMLVTYVEAATLSKSNVK